MRCPRLASWFGVLVVLACRSEEASSPSSPGGVDAAAQVGAAAGSGGAAAAGGGKGGGGAPAGGSGGVSAGGAGGSPTAGSGGGAGTGVAGAGSGGGSGVAGAGVIDARPADAVRDVGGDGSATAPASDARGGGVLTGAAAGPASVLAGYRWELPCKDKNARDTCAWDSALLDKGTKDPNWTLKIEDVRMFGGKADTTYDVTLRFRGVSEPKNFTGGMVLENHFQIGGMPIANDYNIYSIKVSEPAQTYTVNRHQKSVGHFTFVFDYTVTVKIKGGATVTLGTYDRNNLAIANPGGASGSNMPFVVPGVPPAPLPFLGHFIQMDVVAVSPPQ